MTNSHLTEFLIIFHHQESFLNFSILTVISNEQDWTESGQARMGHWINLDGQFELDCTFDNIGHMVETLDGHEWTNLGGQWKTRTF